MEKVELKAISNGKLIELTRVFKKILSVDMDFDNLDEMLGLVDDSIEIELAIKSYSKLEEKLREDAKAKLKDASDQDAMQIENDFIKKINALTEKESSVAKSIKKISEGVIKKAKLTIAEYKVLKELKLV